MKSNFKKRRGKKRVTIIEPEEELEPEPELKIERESEDEFPECFSDSDFYLN